MDIPQVRNLMRSGTGIQQLPLRVTFYARVSTEREEQASSLENQIAYYTSFIQSNPHWIFVDGYIDDGLSGASTLKRNSFNRMIKDAKSGRFDFIITKEISRFSRNTIDSLQYTQELLRHNVGILFQNDNINTFDTDGELRLTIMSSLAQDELRRLSERVKFGHKQCIKNGKVLGNDRLYGYNKKNCILTINEEQAEVVRLIFDLYANQNLGLRRISHALFARGITSSNGNTFNTRTMTNMLNNPKYKGFYCGNKTSCIDYRTKKSVFLPESEWVVYRDENIPAIVSEVLWDKAHALLKARSKQLRSSGAIFHNRYAYSSKIVCEEHGTSYQRQMRESGREIWLCRTYREKGAAGCTAPILYTAELDEIMADIFRRIKKDKTKIIGQLLSLIAGSPDRKNYDKEIGRLENELTAIEDKKDKLLELSIAGALSNREFKKRNDTLNTKIEQIHSQLGVVNLEQKKSVETSSNYEKIKQALEAELSFENGVNSELVASVVEKIIVKNTGSKTHVKLEIHLTMGDKIPIEYEKSRLSVCSSNS